MLPLAIVVEDYPPHQTLAQIHLAAAGFEVEVTSSVDAGVRKALELLSCAQPARAVLILADLHLPKGPLHTLDGSVLAIAIREALQQGHIHPPHLVAITGEIDPELRQAALDAGFSHVLRKPLTRTMATDLHSLVQQAAPCPQPADRLSVRYATQMLVLAEAHYDVVQWGEADIRELLWWGAAKLESRPWSAWADERGGSHAILQRLQQHKLPPNETTTLYTHLSSWQEGHDWNFFAQKLALGKTAYYARLKSLVKRLEILFNTWPPDDML